MTEPLLYECPSCGLRSTAGQISFNKNKCPGCDEQYVYTWRSL